MEEGKDYAVTIYEAMHGPNIKGAPVLKEAGHPYIGAQIHDTEGKADIFEGTKHIITIRNLSMDLASEVSEIAWNTTPEETRSSEFESKIEKALRKK